MARSFTKFLSVLQRPTNVNSVSRQFPTNVANCQPGKVILHQLDTGFVTVPNVSPACLKLETYLRMANIPYIECRGLELSSKGKVPWIEYKGQKIADSNFIIDFLNREFNVDVDRDLSPEQKAISLSLKRMVEENTYWAFAYYRWIDNFEYTVEYFNLHKSRVMNRLFLKLGQSIIKRQLYQQGTGRHSRDEIYQIARDDFKALSVFLGSKQFMMGSKPSLLDATVLGLVAQIIWVDRGGAPNLMMKEDFPNLQELCFRLKEKFWPDWDEIVKRVT